MTDIDAIWFQVQFLKDGVDDFEEIYINFPSLISLLASVEKHKLLKISKADFKFSDRLK